MQIDGSVGLNNINASYCYQSIICMYCEMIKWKSLADYTIPVELSLD